MDVIRAAEEPSVSQDPSQDMPGSPGAESSGVGEEETSDSEGGRSEIKDVEEQQESLATYRYTREELLAIRRSQVVKSAPIALESETFRELQLQVDGFFDNGPVHPPPPARVLPPQGPIPGPQQPPMGWKEDSWRAPHKAAAGNSAQAGPIRSRLVDDGMLAGSPDKDKGPPGGPPGRPIPGWRRGQEWRGNAEGEEPFDNRRQQRMQPQGLPGREEERWGSAPKDETWRPPPPGLGRGQPRGPPPGLVGGPNGSGEHWERPWGAGRGRPTTNEPRVPGKPRDPPRDPPPKAGEKPVPDGWMNRNRESEGRLTEGDWRSSKGKSSEPSREWDRAGRGHREGPPSRQEGRSFEGNGNRAPEWLADGEEAEEGLTLAERQRREFEAERKAMQEERVKSGNQAVPPQGPVNDMNEMISDAELESMRDEEPLSKSAEPEPVKAAEPQATSKPANPSPNFSVDSLFADTLDAPTAGLKGEGAGPAGKEAARGNAAGDAVASRFGRFFQLEASPSSGVKQTASGPAPQQDGPLSLPPILSSTMPLFDAAPASTAEPPSIASEAFLSLQPRNLLAQLQQGSGYGLAAQQQQQQQQMQQQLSYANGLPQLGYGQGPTHTLNDVEKLLQEKALLSPRSEPGAPLQRNALMKPGNLQANTGNALLSLLQGLDKGPQRAASVEPTFANPNPQQQQMQQHQAQQLLNGLNLGGIQMDQLGPNLLQQLQLRAQQAAGQQQQQQQQQHQHAPTNSNAAALANNPLLAAFSAQMPRENSAGKQLADDLFSFGPREQLGGRQLQPTHLGLGQGERGGLQPHLANHAFLQNNPQLAQQYRAATPHAPYGFSQGGNVGMGQAGLPARLGTPGLGQPTFSGGFSQAPQHGYDQMSQVDANMLARLIEQRRAQELQQQQQQQQQAAQQRLLQQQRMYQFQLAQQQAQQQAQQRAAQQAALLRQQQQQQQSLGYGGLGNQLTPTEAALRQQQMLQYQAMNMGANVQNQAPNSAANDSLARFFQASGLNQLGGPHAP